MTISLKSVSNTSYSPTFCKSIFYSVIDQQSFDITLDRGLLNIGCQSPHNLLNNFSKQEQLEENTILSKEDYILQKKIEMFYSYNINSDIAKQIQLTLNFNDVVLSYDTDIEINADISWKSNKSLTIKSKHNINLKSNVKISNLGEGIVKLMAGIESDDNTATVNFLDNASIVSNSKGQIKIYYNPVSEKGVHKYLNPQDIYSHIYPPKTLTSYMLVNNINDLQDIKYNLYSNYALSRDIEGSDDIAFIPLGSRAMPFSGTLEGLGHQVSSIYINGDKQVAIFGLVIGTSYKKACINDLSLTNIHVNGSSYISLLAAQGQFLEIHHITLKTGNDINAFSIAGSLIGSGSAITIKDIVYKSPTKISGDEFVGQIAGALKDSDINLRGICNEDCVGKIIQHEEVNIG